MQLKQIEETKQSEELEEDEKPKQYEEPEEDEEPQEDEEPERYDMSNVLPSIPVPFVVSAEDRILQLEGFLEETWHRRQRTNIETLINMYRAGELKSLRGPPDRTWLYLCGGEVFDHHPSDEVTKGRAVWHEAVLQQMVHQSPPGTGAEPPKQQMKVYSSYHAESGVMHKFQAALRLKPTDSSTEAERKNLPSVVIEISNDTGSNVLSVFGSDLDKLNFNEATYHKIGSTMNIMTASGFIQRLTLVVQLRVLDNDGLRMTDWFDEQAIVIENPIPGMERLSGKNIRNELYFASDQKQRLFIDISKNAVFGLMR